MRLLLHNLTIQSPTALCVCLCVCVTERWGSQWQIKRLRYEMKERWDIREKEKNIFLVYWKHSNIFIKYKISDFVRDRRIKSWTVYLWCLHRPQCLLHVSSKIKMMKMTLNCTKRGQWEGEKGPSSVRWDKDIFNNHWTNRHETDSGQMVPRGRSLWPFFQCLHQTKMFTHKQTYNRIKVHSCSPEEELSGQRVNSSSSSLNTEADAAMCATYRQCK